MAFKRLATVLSFVYLITATQTLVSLSTIKNLSEVSPTSSITVPDSNQLRSTNKILLKSSSESTQKISEKNLNDKVGGDSLLTKSLVSKNANSNLSGPEAFRSSQNKIVEEDSVLDKTQQNGFGNESSGLLNKFVKVFTMNESDKYDVKGNTHNNESKLPETTSTNATPKNNIAAGQLKPLNTPVRTNGSSNKNNSRSRSVKSKIEPSQSKINPKFYGTASHVLRLEEKINSLNCELLNFFDGSSVWRGNETHELNFPINHQANCSSNECDRKRWEASAEIQSGDVLIVEIDDKMLIIDETSNANTKKIIHRSTAAVYQVTRLGHENCDITEGELLDITPLVVDDKKLITLYDKDLTEGVNLLIVVANFWNKCVRLRINVKSDNCGENSECSGKGICFSNNSMEGYECDCCNGYVGPHCEEIDGCTPTPCTNNGICVDLSQGHDGHSYQCLCPYGYTGKNCQTEADPCSQSQCINGGTCITNSSNFKIPNSTFPKFRCECPRGFAGPLCQHNLNECDSSPCVHGICVDQEDGFRCFCQHGFSGDLCNFEYNECDSNPCINGGQCSIDRLDQGENFSCKCTKGYQGNRCHIKIDFCGNNPCEDGFRCVDHGDEFSCVCPGAGDHNVPDCTEVPRLLCAKNPCLNGGTCWSSDESFYCACPPGFVGKLCNDDFVIDAEANSSELLGLITFNDSIDDDKDDKPEGSHMYLISFLVFLAFVISVFYLKRRKGYRKFKLSQLRLFLQKKPRNEHWLAGKNTSFFQENHINLKNDRHPPRLSSNSILNQTLERTSENEKQSDWTPLIP